ncbi:pyridoxamine 5'-phosphate oxidase family protein [Polyangium aurulentum]|uniref:pyridoxamine 5'-phosphate oxidase family protein n=1 Tax=Polyangium aurulentum TaxID=2567896 RepID=UPI0010ADF126|nr:pyridoxamine 5'-phosphate oxidase family protein [Polyangium aurulentum]UQA56941.1 pyridoxamine 5'-phosphate oxidase family protein [Polyangium aurulentum]
MDAITSVEQLERIVGARSLGPMMKSIDHLDAHCARLLALSPFAALGVVDAKGRARITTVGGSPGFAEARGERELRFRSMEPLEVNPKLGCGMLFFIPGLGETLRVNGRIEQDGHALLVRVEEAFAHCAKALLRSAFWRGGASEHVIRAGDFADGARRAEGALADPEVLALLARSPFVLLGSCDGGGAADVSPKGDPAGFLRIRGTQIVIPDRPGNRRTDTLHNALERPEVALLALVPGEDRVVEISGTAKLSAEPALLASMTVDQKTPKIALVLEATTAEVRPSRAIAEAQLWDAGRHVPEDQRPNMTKVFADHVKGNRTRGWMAGVVRTLASERLLEKALAHDYKSNLY